MKESRELKIIQARELLFSESIARNMARIFFDEQIAKTKLKKTSFPYQHTLLNIPNGGGLNFASDGISI